MNTPRRLGIFGIIIVIAISGWVANKQTATSDDASTTESTATATNIPPALIANFSTDFSNSNLTDFSAVLNGGPGKDGIPAISSPKFVPIAESTTDDDVRGILVTIDGEKRYYPYNILVWHEIVNDTIGNTNFAVTFCPLCGSAVVYDRTINGEVLDFGVSGYLRESNMIMFDRTNETLWQQATGEAFAGKDTGQSLERLQFGLLTMQEIKQEHPSAVILSTETGITRDYTTYPYGDYDTNEELFFPVTINDQRFPAKEIFYISTIEGQSVALRINGLKKDAPTRTITQDGLTLTVSKKGGEVMVQNSKGVIVPGYYEMWFSWATWHSQSGGVVINPTDV